MDVLMPQLGETVAEGKITKWFKSAGDAVKPGDNLFEIETDKVSMEVPSIAAGTLSEIRVPAGEVAPVGAVVAVIAGDGAATCAQPPQRQPRLLRVPERGRATTPLIPAQAGIQGQALGPRFRGDERPARAASLPTPNIDPFFEVRTPARNYGPARLPAAPT